jgi:hypothetical protein
MQYIEVDANQFEETTSFEDMKNLERAANGEDHAKGKLRKKLKKAASSKFGRIAAGILTGGASVAASKKGRADLKKGAKKVGKIAKKVLQASAFLPLFPLKPMLVKILKGKGKNVSMKTDMADLANMFYNTVVRKQDKSFEAIDLDEITSTDEHVIGTAVAAVVGGIISFIKAIKKKKAAGQKLTKIEEDVATGTEQVEKQIKEGAQDEAAQSVGKKLLFDRKTQLIVVGVVVAIIAFVFVVRKKMK